MDCIVNRIMCQSLDQVQPEDDIISEISDRYPEIYIHALQ